MADHSMLDIKARHKQTLAAQFFRLKKGLGELLESGEMSEARLLRLLQSEDILSERLLSALPRLIEGELKTLTALRRLTRKEASERRSDCRTLDFEAIAESASPLHSLLLEKAVYADSDAPTRRRLRAEVADFSKRHRLTDGQAASIWTGKTAASESLGRWFLSQCLLWLPPVFAFGSVILFGAAFWGVLTWGIFPIMPALFFPIREGSAKLIEGALRLILPSAALPSLNKEKAPPVCALLVASATDDPEAVLCSLEMLIAANRALEGPFGLILTLPDAPTAQTVEDAALCEPFLKGFEALEKRTERPLRLSVAQRSYRPREKNWSGSLTDAELLSACSAVLSDDRSPFLLTLGSKAFSRQLQALYLAPADARLSPDGLRTLACTLFHPLTAADCVLPILRSADDAKGARALTARQATLQKLGGALPFPGFGMIRLSALGRKQPLVCALAGGDLNVKRLPTVRISSKPAKESLLLGLLPSLREDMGTLLRLPLFLMLMLVPPHIACLGLLLANADLAADALISLRLGVRFTSYTCPHLAEIGKIALKRLIFPIQQCLSVLPPIKCLSESAQKRIHTLLPIGAGIAAAALCPLPGAVAGLAWAFSPLLVSPSVKRKSRLSASDRAYLLAKTKDSWTFFEKQVTPDRPLPPIGILAQPYPRTFSETSPDAFAFYLIACLSACDLGLIDPFTLEKRVCASLDDWERLPAYHGLPYARYSLQTKDSSGQVGVDSAACGRFALGMAALSEGLLEYSPQNPSLKELARRVCSIWQRMDFSYLYDRRQSAFCQTVLPNGEPTGRLDLLMSDAMALCIASLASGELDRSAWRMLRRPVVGRGLRIGIGSPNGSLEEYLLSSLFLPTRKGSLIDRARSYACRCSEGYSNAHCILSDGNPSTEPLPSGQPSLALLHSDEALRIMPPHSAFLMLPFEPTRALKRLRQFEAMGAAGEYGFCEAIDYSRSNDGRVVRMWSSAHIGQSMAATVNCLKGNLFQKRLMRIPAFASLEPLLSEPIDRLEPPIIPRRVRTCFAQTEAEADRPEALFPPLFLLGDSRWGLLWADGRRMLPFSHRKASAYSASPHYLYEDGHFSGLLLFRDREPITARPVVCRRALDSLTLRYPADDCSVFAALTLPEPDLLELVLSTDGTTQPLDALFCYCPLPNDGAFRLETLPLSNLLLILSANRAVAIMAEGLDRLFIRAEEAPLPLGRQNLSALLEREGSFTEGTLLTPACRLGGRLKGSKKCRFRLAFGKNRADVLEKLSHALRGRDSKASRQGLQPLPEDEHSAQSYALIRHLQTLFEEGKLHPILPASEEDDASCERSHLHQCLQNALETLKKRGFEADDQPFSLSCTADRPTDELLRESLIPKARPSLCAPPMPPHTRIKLTESQLTVMKGRDLPPVCRVYADQHCAFYADSYTPSFRFEASASPTPIMLTLPESGNESEERALFYAATEVSYGQSEVCYTGDGYRVTARLSAEYHLLHLEVESLSQAKIRLALPSPSATSEDSDFWHPTAETVDFCLRSYRGGRTVFLLGSFSRSSDRRYYLIRERLAADLPFCESLSASDTLTWQSQPPYPTPLLVHPALASDSSLGFPLRLLFDQSNAYSCLVRTVSGENDLLKVIFCMLWEQFTEDRDALRRKYSRSTPSGEVIESLYLSSARALDRLCEEGKSPLLPRLTAAFAGLARRMGDHAGEEIYRTRCFPDPPTDISSSDSFESIALLLLEGNPCGTAAWKRRIDALPLFPSPEEASALWSLFWYGVLGYREDPRGFSLSPILGDGFGPLAFTLRRKETLYRIRIAFSAHTACLLDGKSAQPPFLFDKKAHFLEITVEKSARMV